MGLSIEASVLLPKASFLSIILKSNIWAKNVNKSLLAIYKQNIAA
jgi:hypothetical protein